MSCTIVVPILVMYILDIYFLETHKKVSRPIPMQY